MKSIIPFTKDLDFASKVSEITSISLEREFSVLETSIEGNLLVSGEYKTHEVSANVLPFSYKIPFSIEIPSELVKETITLEISDFAYEMKDETGITVNVELELNGEYEEVKDLEEEEEKKEERIDVDSLEIIKMMEEDREDVSEKEEEKSEIIETTPEPVEERDVLEEEKETSKESEEMILNHVTDDDEYKTYHIHIVKDGETVETICTMYHSNLSMLSEYNDLENLTSGSKIIIPEEDES